MTAQILLVDDEISVLNSLKRVLQTEGYEIDVATSGPEAIEILSEKDVAVILCDHNMAGMTGPEEGVLRPSFGPYVAFGAAADSACRVKFSWTAHQRPIPGHYVAL